MRTLIVAALLLLAAVQGNGMEAYGVSKLVTDPRNDSPARIEPDQLGPSAMLF